MSWVSEKEERSLTAPCTVSGVVDDVEAIARRFPVGVGIERRGGASVLVPREQSEVPGATIGGGGLGGGSLIPNAAE